MKDEVRKKGEGMEDGSSGHSMLVIGQLLSKAIYAGASSLPIPS